MDELIFSMDMDHPGVVPDGFPVPVNEFGAEYLDHHGYYNEFEHGTYPYASGHCHTNTFSCTKSCNFMSDTTTGSADNWLEETAELSQFIRHEALSDVSSESNSPVGSWDREEVIKSPMQILEEIREEASQFHQLDGASNSSFTEMIPVQVSSAAFASSPKEFTQLQPMGTTAQMNGHDGGVPELAIPIKPEFDQAPAPRELSQEEINNLMSNQGQFLVAGSPGLSPHAESPGLSPDAEPPVVAPIHLQLVHMVGNEVILPDGRKAVIIDQPTIVQATDVDQTTAPAPKEAGKPVEGARKKRDYQKGSRERKKMQNRESSFRYRIKKKDAKDQQLQEYTKLSTRNKELRDKAEDLVREIEYWKKFVSDLQK